MLDKLLGNLKKNLPESLRKKMGSEEESQEDESAEYSEEESEESHDSSANEPSAEDKKKKQISMIIRVVVILALGYMVVTEFIFKPEPENNELPAVTIKRKPRKKPEEVKPADATAEAAKPADPAAQSAQSAQTPPAEISPAEAPAVAEVPETKPEAASEPSIPVEAPKEEIKTAEGQAPVENINIADKAIDETPIVRTPPAETAPQTGEVKNGASQVEKSLDALIENMNEGTPGEDAPKKSKLEDKIVADDVYTPPPAYDQLGRGLVYNCKEKFWACLDKNAYVACNKNMKWNKTHNKAAECAVQSVYNSDEDCNTVQKYNVSTNVPTTFCQ